VAPNLTDKVADADAGVLGAFSSSAATFRKDITSLLGEPSPVPGGTERRHTCELATGGRVVLIRSTAVVKLILLQWRYADIERREEG
jgi:hypothetical protein